MAEGRKRTSGHRVPEALTKSTVLAIVPAMAAASFDIAAGIGRCIPRGDAGVGEVGKQTVQAQVVVISHFRLRVGEA